MNASKVAASTSSRVPRPLLSEPKRDLNLGPRKFSQTSSCLSLIIVDVVLLMFYRDDTGCRLVYDLYFYTCVSMCVDFNFRE